MMPALQHHIISYDAGTPKTKNKKTKKKFEKFFRRSFYSPSSSVVNWLSPSSYFEKNLSSGLALSFLTHPAFVLFPRIWPLCSRFARNPHWGFRCSPVCQFAVNFAPTDDSRISIFALVRFCRASPPVATSPTISPLDYSQRHSKENPFLPSFLPPNFFFFFSIFL